VRFGIATLEDCRSFTGGSTVKAAIEGRTTLKLEAEGQAYFLKRVQGPDASEIANEAHVLGNLRSLGLPVAEVVAVGSEGDFAALVTVGLPVRGTLEKEVLEESPEGGRDVSRRSRQVASILRRLHKAGVQHRDFYLTHILVGLRGELYVADFGRARMLPRLGWLQRIKDLAALDYSTPARVVPEWSRLRFLRWYAGPKPKWRLRLLASLTRAKARAVRRHVERRVAQLRPNFHVTG
jgi:heptose I phosphotransferase